MTDIQATRIQILIAKAGIASRRAAEDIIKKGRVSLNGVVVTELGVKASVHDTITVDGKLISYETELNYLALNKPPGYICAMRDDFGRPLAVSLFKPDIKERIYNVGRLDIDSRGLIIFTNDGLFASKLGHPRYEFVKEYIVRTDKPIPTVFTEQFMSGIVDDGEVLKAKQVVLINNKTCRVYLVEGKNREIRRALAHFNLRVTELTRISIGEIKLGDLPEGKWRRLYKHEIDMVLNK